MIKNKYTVGYQEGMNIWENRRINPDLVIRQGEEIVIIDTKWKLIDPNKPSDDDLKQMFVYNIHWSARKSILLYPKTGDKRDGEYGKFHKGLEDGHYCKIGFVNVMNDAGELNMSIAKEVIEKI